MNDDNRYTRNHFVASLIKSYLQKHPEAMDSFDGINSWWIKQAKLDESANDVAQALEILIESGVVEEVENDFYRCASTHQPNNQT